MSKKFLNLDERNVLTIFKICTTLYIITMMMLIGVQLYRQFVLQQETDEWKDIANIITFNVLVLFGAVLYLGGFNPEKVKIRHIVTIYIGFVLIGLIFTVFKYAVLLGERISLVDVKEYFIIVSVICGLLIIFWSLLAFLGKRRIDKQIE